MAELSDARGGVAEPKRGTRAKKKHKRALARPRARKRATATKLRYATVDPAKKSVDDFVRAVRGATPLELVEIERRGVAGGLVKSFAKQLDLPAVRVFDMFRLPKATIARKSSTGAVVSGSAGHAAIGMAKLLAIAQDIVANSTAPEAENVDAAKWLGRWLQRPQPSLGGRRPGELLDTPTGVAVVSRLLGAVESGAYQ